MNLDQCNKLNILKHNQGPDTRHRVFQVPLCHWFERQTLIFNWYQQILCHTMGDKTRQEAESCALSPALVVSDNSW